jgi:hypothetical protein
MGSFTCVTPLPKIAFSLLMKNHAYVLARFPGFVTLLSSGDNIAQYVHVLFVNTLDYGE